MTWIRRPRVSKLIHRKERTTWKVLCIFRPCQYIAIAKVHLYYEVWHCFQHFFWWRNVKELSSLCFHLFWKLVSIDLFHFLHFCQTRKTSIHAKVYPQSTQAIIFGECSGILWRMFWYSLSLTFLRVIFFFNCSYSLANNLSLGDTQDPVLICGRHY